MKAPTRFRQHGLAAIEFTLAAPVMLLVLLGLAELGRAFYQYNTLAKAVRDAARYYAVNTFVGTTTTPDAAKAAAAVNIVRYGVPAPQSGQALLLPHDPPAVTASVDAAGNYVTVSASYTFSFLAGNPLSRLLGLFGGSLASPLTLRASEVMRVL